MDILELNALMLSMKRDHMKHSIKYRKFVKKIISLMDIPEVIFKFIFNYVGSSQFPMNSYFTKYRHSRVRPKLRPRFALKNTVISHPLALEGMESQGMESQETKNESIDLEQ